MRYIVSRVSTISHVTEPFPRSQLLADLQKCSTDTRIEIRLNPLISLQGNAIAAKAVGHYKKGLAVF